jgi:UDP-glucose:(heptosyl)LPS alpha-1,3-glucosyltransferase
VRVAVVFPRANRRAGVERVAWDLSDYLGANNDASFVGVEMEESGANSACFHAVPRKRLLPESLSFRFQAQHILDDIQPDVVLTLGAVCPSGDVYWVQSVHLAYLEGSPGPTISGWQSPAWLRRCMPRHQLILGLERRYFESSIPTIMLCTSAQEVLDLGTYYGVAGNRCKVVPNGFDPKIFNPVRRNAIRDGSRTQLGMRSDEVSLLFVANELHRKGFGSLIAALAKVKSPSTRVDVVGRVSSGDYRSKIERLGLTRNIHWHGSTNDVFPYYAAADILVLPTLYEPFGLVIIEALASGLPVVTSRLAGASSAVESGQCGRLLADPTDVEELATYLAEGLDPAVRRGWEVGAAAAAKPFAWPTIFSEIEAILQQAHLDGQTGR